MTRYKMFKQAIVSDDSFKFDATYVISEQGRAVLESKGE